MNTPLELTPEEQMRIALEASTQHLKQWEPEQARYQQLIIPSLQVLERLSTPSPRTVSDFIHVARRIAHQTTVQRQQENRDVFPNEQAGNQQYRRQYNQVLDRWRNAELHLGSVKRWTIREWIDYWKMTYDMVYAELDMWTRSRTSNAVCLRPADMIAVVQRASAELRGILQHKFLFDCASGQFLPPVDVLNPLLHDDGDLAAAEAATRIGWSLQAMKQCVATIMWAILYHQAGEAGTKALQNSHSGRVSEERQMQQVLEAMARSIRNTLNAGIFMATCSGLSTPNSYEAMEGYCATCISLNIQNNYALRASLERQFGNASVGLFKVLPDAVKDVVIDGALRRRSLRRNNRKAKDERVNPYRMAAAVNNLLTSEARGQLLEELVDPSELEVRISQYLASDPYEVIEKNEEAAAFRRILSPQQERIVLLREEELSYKEIAAEIQTSEDVVKAQFYNIRKAARTFRDELNSPKK